MESVKILVVEDEVIIADSICYALEDLGYTPLEPVMDYEEALSSLDSEMPDLVLLDIQLAGQKDGIELAHEINAHYRIPFIFLTSNADPATVKRAKEVTPAAYLVKPFNKQDLYTSIEMALHNFYANSSVSNGSQEILIEDALFLKEKNLYYKVAHADICYLKSDHVYVEIYTHTKHKFVLRTSLQALLDKLPPYFFRTHRSYAINLHRLEAINSLYVLIEGEQVPIGKSYRNELMQRVDIC